MIITDHLFEAFLKCPTKCWLRARGERPSGNTYAEWVHSQNEFFGTGQTERLLAEIPPDQCFRSPAPKKLKTSKWRMAVNVVVRSPVPPHVGPSSATSVNLVDPEHHATRPFEVGVLESNLHAIERIPFEGIRKSAELVPIRFIPFNKLTKDDKLLLAFDAFVLAHALGRKIERGKIIHGHNQAMLKVKTAALTSEVRKRLVEKLSPLLCSPTPPDLVLNRHCGECGFQTRCRQKALETDDLSLLSGISAKARQDLHSKGIFTVRQLSYTFRPRRRAKRMRDKPEKYHHSLKALAIREKKIHVVGNPKFKIEGTPVYLDVEGLPDRDFYYLIGLRVGSGDSAVQHSLWADTVKDEERIWREFLAIIQRVEKPMLIHYGSYETEFRAKMGRCYGPPNERTLEPSRSPEFINLLSVLLDQVYFPTYSNSLKEIGAWLGCIWSDFSPSGINSVPCRCEWEQTQNPSLKALLIAYNKEDCQAVEKVVQTLLALCTPETQNGQPEKGIDTVSVKSLKRPERRWGTFVSPIKELEEINQTAWWDYQRDRIYVKSGFKVKCKTHRPIRSTRWINRLPINKFIDCADRSACPFCGGRPTKIARSNRTLHDLRFGRASVRRWIVKYRFNQYRCSQCEMEFGEPAEFVPQSHFGRNFLAYVIHEAIELHIPIVTIQKNLSRFFGLDLKEYTLRFLKQSAAKHYKVTYESILNHLATGSLLQADETDVSIRGKPAYVWVFTNLEDVAYLYTSGREGKFLHEMLKGFKGVLISDFYGAYDSLECEQQKCLVHLIRDLNDDVLAHPYDDELKFIVKNFAVLLKSIVASIDRWGLKRRFLAKHRMQVRRFQRMLDNFHPSSPRSIKCKERFVKNCNKLFTFLDHDGVPWNNSNAEHAVKAFAKLRDIVRGSFTESSVCDYLILLSVCETCKYRGLDFFDFLRSGENDIYAFAKNRRGRRRWPITSDSKTPPANASPTQ